MKLREHPLLLWPMVWVHTRSKPTKTISQDAGNLIQVTRNNLSPKMLFLISNVDGNRYMGALLCQDLTSAREFQDFLQQHIGKSIREIGDLDVSFLL